MGRPLTLGDWMLKYNSFSALHLDGAHVSRSCTAFKIFLYCVMDIWFTANTVTWIYRSV